MASISTSDTASQRTREGMPRAASYTYLRSASENNPQHGDTPPLPRNSKDDESHLEDDAGDNHTSGSSGFTTPDEYPELTVPPASAEVLLEELKKVPSARTRRSNDHFYDSKSSFESSLRHSNSSIESARTGSTGDTSLSGSEQGPTETKRTSRRFGRHSWYGLTSSDSSRSPSPPKAESIPACPPIPNPIPTPPPRGHIRKKSLIRGRDTVKMFKGAKLPTTTGLSAETDDPKKSPVRRTTLLKKRPISGIFRSGTNDIKDDSHHNPVPVPPMPPSFSAEKLPIVWSSVLPIDRGIPSPRLAPPERSRSRSRSATRKKDELWSVFRSLEADFVRFSSKSSALKTNVVRDSLLPFLRGYADHPSNERLCPEDLERRVNILNMWWTGLIEMLHGRNSLSLSGTDRPAVLDGVVGIMERPEWRQSSSPFSPLAKRKQFELTPSHSTTSLTSSTSDFLSESVYHHVRNVFVQNLTTQMVFVVDKMSLRNTSASLVIFCGKACAYAFTFVPSMADILVRLWATPKDTIRRVLEENGIGKFDSVPESVSGPVVANYPPALHQLGFVSLAKCVRTLRGSPQLPLGTAKVPWWGRWVDRWRGLESDLFYVFVKHFHILASDFILPDSSLMERLCIPGLVLVHAQMLFNLDATIHRDANQLQSEPSATSTLTFDDLLADPDAVATPLPVLPNTAVRFMAENRLIMLMRDFLSERTAAHPQARQMFARSVNALLQATAKKTSMFDHGACFTLLDFLEEAFVLLVRYEQLKELDGRLIDSGFWLEVYRRMIGSENTMTDIRLYAFLYTLWNTIAPDWGRKMSLCLDLLLERNIFESRFNHWCPMVRAYYMRLLCWRVLRYDGEEHDGDLQIMETMRTRLQENWSHYLYLRRQAEQQGGFFPTSHPCNAAPGRRLLIMRIDTPLAPDTSFMSFDGSVRSTRGDQSAARSGTHSHGGNADAGGGGDPEFLGKGIGGFLRKMAWTTSSSRTRSKSPNPASENAEADDLANKETPQATPKHRHFSFRFSLEPQHHHHNNYHYHYSANGKRISGHPPMRLQPPRLPSPAQAFLQSQVPEGAITSLPMTADMALLPDSTSRYCGRALAEWTIVVGECQGFFERRRHEGVPCNRLVETPILGVETFRRPS